MFATFYILKLYNISDFSINGLCTENSTLSQRTPAAQYKIKVN